MRAVGYIIFLLAGLYQLVLGYAFFNAQWGLLGVLAFFFFPPLTVLAPFVMWGLVGVFPSVYFVAWVVGWIGLLLASGDTLPGWAAWSLRFVALLVFVVVFWPAAIVWGALMVRQYVKDRAAPAPPVATSPPPQIAPVAPGAHPETVTETARREREENNQMFIRLYLESDAGKRMKAERAEAAKRAEAQRIDAAKRMEADAAAPPFCGSCGKARDGLSQKFCRWCGAAQQDA